MDLLGGVTGIPARKIIGLSLKSHQVENSESQCGRVFPVQIILYSDNSLADRIFYQVNPTVNTQLFHQTIFMPFHGLGTYYP